MWTRSMSLKVTSSEPELQNKNQKHDLIDRITTLACYFPWPQAKASCRWSHYPVHPNFHRCILQIPWVLSGYRTIQHLILLPTPLLALLSHHLLGSSLSAFFFHCLNTLFFLAAPKNKTLMEPFHSGQVFIYTWSI